MQENDEDQQVNNLEIYCDDEQNEDNIKFYEFGAHFKYDDLYRRLESYSKRENYKAKNKTLKIFNLNLQLSRNINPYIVNKKQDKKGSSDISNELSLMVNKRKPNYKKTLGSSSLTITEQTKKEKKEKKETKTTKDKGKSKNTISKRPIQIIAQIDLRNDIKDSENIDIAERQTKSASPSKKKKDNISDIVQIKKMYASNKLNNMKNDSNNQQKRLSNSSQNFTFKKKYSSYIPHNCNNNNAITNMKYQVHKCKPSPQKKKSVKSNPHLTNNYSNKKKSKTSVLNIQMNKSRNWNQKGENENNINNNKNNVKKTIKSSPNKVGMTFQKSELTKPEKKIDFLQKDYMKPKPHSQEKPKMSNEHQSAIKQRNMNMNKKDKCIAIQQKMFNDKQTKYKGKTEKSLNYSTKFNSSKSSSLPQLEIKVQIIQNDIKKLSIPQSKSKDIKKKIFNKIASLQLGNCWKSSSTNKKTSRNNRIGTSISKHQIINSTTKTQNTNTNTYNIRGNISRNIQTDNHKILSSNNNKNIIHNEHQKLKPNGNSTISNSRKVSCNLNKPLNNINTNILKNFKTKNEITKV